MLVVDVDLFVAALEFEDEHEQQEADRHSRRYRGSVKKGSSSTMKLGIC
jgi:hypothetical protein